MENVRLSLRFDFVTRSQSLAFCGLAFHQGRFGEFAVAADFEGAEVFVPGSIGRVGFGLRFHALHLKALCTAMHQVLRMVRPQMKFTDSWHAVYCGLPSAKE